MKIKIPFPPDFRLGAATAAYQIEGATDKDGKGLSIWDQYARHSGRVHLNETGDIACDHYHHLDEDLNLMAEIGLQAYRFSFAWTRLLPNGTSRLNQKGLAFYDRLIDGLLERGIEPYATCFHWDYPLALYRQGGWLNPKSADWFENYVTVLAKHFGDRISHWMTINEPQIFVAFGHGENSSVNYAPGVKLGNADLVPLAHNVLRAHGRAVKALREHCKKPPTIGWAQACNAMIATNAQDGELVERAYQQQFSMENTRTNWALQWSWWNDAAVLGEYPEDGLAYLGQHLPKRWERDLKSICQPIDFIGLNCYSAWHIFSRNGNGEISSVTAWEQDNGFPETHFGWPVVPEALYWAPKHFHRRYNLPIIITENGMAGHDWVHLDGKCHDDHRIDFTTRYLRALSSACADGVDVRAYFHWSLMDNFEWGDGYKHRFGLIHVDFRNPARPRTLKDSAYWYHSLIAAHSSRD
ncbi:MAG: glycoside hydrolase family 1 protein [Puniceicoccaceae bacterium]